MIFSLRQISPRLTRAWGRFFVAVFVANFIAIFDFSVAKMVVYFLATGRNEELRNVWALPNFDEENAKNDRPDFTSGRLLVERVMGVEPTKNHAKTLII